MSANEGRRPISPCKTLVRAFASPLEYERQRRVPPLALALIVNSKALSCSRERARTARRFRGASCSVERSQRAVKGKSLMSLLWVLPLIGYSLVHVVVLYRAGSEIQR